MFCSYCGAHQLDPGPRGGGRGEVADRIPPREVGEHLSRSPRRQPRMEASGSSRGPMADASGSSCGPMAEAPVLRRLPRPPQCSAFVEQLIQELVRATSLERIAQLELAIRTQVIPPLPTKAEDLR